MYRLFQISVLFLTALFFISCGSDSLAPDPDKNNSEIQTMETHTQGEIGKPGLDSGLHASLAQVRRATARYHNVTNAEKSGYVQISPFVPGMGYHYGKESLLDDAEVIPSKPEALVYVDNPADDSKRRLVAVEYIIPVGFIDEDRPSELEGKFPGVDGDKWHFEEDIQAWTLHAWVWYPNPEGIFHPTNPRVNPDQN